MNLYLQEKGEWKLFEYNSIDELTNEKLSQLEKTILESL